MSHPITQLPNIKTNNSQILNDIQSLQNLEQQLFSSLDSNLNLTTSQQQEIVSKINDLSKMRINLYQTIDGLNSYFQSALYNSRGTLDQQAVAIQIVENELNTAKRRLRTLEDAKNNKVRLVEINEYYGDKYAEHSQLMKLIIYTLIPLIIVTAIYNMGFLPNVIYYALIIIISLIAVVAFWYKVWSIWSRDRMNYQAYEWPFNPSDLSSSGTNASDPWASLNSLGTCIGNSCCSEGLVYDDSINQCIVSTNPSSSSSSSPSPSALSVKGFSNNLNNFTTDFSQKLLVTEALTNRMNMNKKPNVMLGGNTIQPNNSESFINYSKF